MNEERPKLRLVKGKKRDRGNARPGQHSPAKTRASQNRRNMWLNQYLAMGPTRSLSKLARIDHLPTGEKPPGLRTLSGWSAVDGWQSKADEFDRQANETQEAELREKQAKNVSNRTDTRLQLSISYQRLIGQALQRPVYQLDEAGYPQTDERGRPRMMLDERGKPRMRLAAFEELSPDDTLKITRLHRMAEQTQLLIDGQPTQITRLQGDENAPLVTKPLDEGELNELRSHIGTLVAELQKEANRQRGKTG